jgi:CDP-diacylglycerol--serine O-phosphatidyltransferase
MELIPRRSSLRPPDMRRVVVVMPSAFTLGNLFFGFWSIVYAFNGNYRWAGWFIVFAAILDMLDGRVARLSNTNSRFGAELDSLVDVISFGVAPALLVYFLDFAAGGRFAWVLCYIYVAGTALRLARYNVLAASGAKSNPGWFTGMPSPAAGCTLAVFYPFSQTEWYRASLAYLDLQHQGLVVLLLLLSLLMVSNVKYPRFPPIGFRSARGLFGLAMHVIILGGGLLWPASFLFPLGLCYMAFGVGRAFILGFMERTDTGVDAAAAPVGGGEIAAVEPPAAHERRRLSGDRRQEPIE